MNHYQPILDILEMYLPRLAELEGGEDFEDQRDFVIEKIDQLCDHLKLLDILD